LTPLYSRGDFGEDDRSISKNRKIEYVDLQPDGNSFDLMSGMIRRKA
jgi:biotin--protein ligase